ncbi:MAG: enoyl-CoA hydratase/isomerase family protein [Gemmatimonadales bacterium]|nr:enoyl-CoA hydratase/isomerase family protein [Gemmatimonadales bacterium]
MEFENLITEIEAGVATVTVNRPDKLNALNKATIDDLHRCFDTLREDPAARVVILRGAGEKAFVAGADIGELANMNSSEAERLAAHGQDMVNKIENLGKPVIAAVNGFALGGGCELAMACTFRYAADVAKLGLPETGLGLIPGFGGTQRLPRLVGRGQALELVLTGGMIDAAEAQRIGLVNKVYPADELMPAVQKVAGKLAAKSSLTLRIALKSIGEGLQMTQDSGCRLEAALFGVCGSSADAREGCQAFMEKRKPEFSDG